MASMEVDQDAKVDNKNEEALTASTKAVFQTLNPGGKSKIELTEVLGRIEDVQNKDEDDKRKTARNKHVEKVIRKLLRAKGGKALEESDMKKVNQRFMDGHLPRLKRHHFHPKDDEEKDEDDMDAPKAGEGVLKMVLRYAVSSVRFIGNYAEKSVSRAGRSWMLTLLPTGQISTLVSFLLFSYVMKASFLSWFIPLAILGISVCVMMVSSIRLVRGMKRFVEFKAWAEFLDSISITQPNSIDTVAAEENYLWNHITPYIHFMIATACCVMGYGTSDKSWVLNAELGILSCFMYILIIYIFGMHKSKKSIAIFVCQIFSAILRGSNRGDGTEVFAFFTSVQVPFVGLVVNVSLSSVLRILLIFQIASLFWNYPRNTKFSMHLAKVVFPHMVVVAWCDVADMFFCYSTLTAVARASVEYLALLFAMPVFTVFFAYAVLKFLFSMELSKVMVTVGLIALPTLYFKAWKKKDLVTKRIGKMMENTSFKATLMVIGVLILGYIMLSYRPAGLKIPDSDLKWEDYMPLCFNTNEPAVPGNTIPLTATCYEFKGYGVTWEGLVENVEIVKIENKVDDLLNLLPHTMATWLSCVYGRPYPTAEACATKEALPTLERSLCAVSPVAKRPCHIQKYNVYKFKITVAMGNRDEPPTFMSLDVSHDFYDMVVELKGKSRIRFSGTLVGDGHTISARVLFTPSEDDKMKGLEKRHRRIEKTLGDMMDEALNALCDFVLYPIISFGDTNGGDD